MAKKPKGKERFTDTTYLIPLKPRKNDKPTKPIKR
jgi:hypothetical protein